MEGYDFEAAYEVPDSVFMEMGVSMLMTSNPSQKDKKARATRPKKLDIPKTAAIPHVSLGLKDGKAPKKDKVAAVPHASHVEDFPRPPTTSAVPEFKPPAAPVAPKSSGIIAAPAVGAPVLPSFVEDEPAAATNTSVPAATNTTAPAANATAPAVAANVTAPVVANATVTPPAAAPAPVNVTANATVATNATRGGLFGVVESEAPPGLPPAPEPGTMDVKANNSAAAALAAAKVFLPPLPKITFGKCAAQASEYVDCTGGALIDVLTGSEAKGFCLDGQTSAVNILELRDFTPKLERFRRELRKFAASSFNVVATRNITNKFNSEQDHVKLCFKPGTYVDKFRYRVKGQFETAPLGVGNGLFKPTIDIQCASDYCKTAKIVDAKGPSNMFLALQL